MSKIKVLLAEDEASLGMIVKESLETRGFTVFHAENGEEALEVYQQEKPDILVLDVMMPKNDGFTLANDDEVKGYLLFSNPHVYGKSIDVKFVMTRVVCNNTLSMALTERGQPAVRLSHRNHFNPEMVKELLGISHNRVEQFKEAAEFLSSKRYSDKAYKLFLSQVFGTSNQEGKILSRTAERALEIVDTQPGADMSPGTWWNAYNSVTYMTDHEMGRSADTRAAAAWFGHNAKRKLDALNLAVEMAEVA